MLRSLKNSLKSGKKGTSSSPKEETQAVVSSSKQQSSSSAKQPVQPAKQQGQPVKEKPPLPVINEQNLQLYYAEPLPSFRECTMMRQGLQYLGKPCMLACMAQHRSLASFIDANQADGHVGITVHVIDVKHPSLACKRAIFTSIRLQCQPAAVAHCRRCTTIRKAAAVCAETPPVLLYV